MLNINIISDPRSKGVKGRTSTKNRNLRLCLIPWSLHRSKIKLFYLWPSILGEEGGKGGGGMQKTTSGSHYLYIWMWGLPVDGDAETLKYHSETGVNSQGINSASLCSQAGRYDNPIPNRFLARIDCSKIPAQVNEPPPPLSPSQPRCMNPIVWESVWPEGAGSDS